MKTVGTFYSMFSKANAFRHPLFASRHHGGQDLAHITLDQRRVRIWNDLHAAERDPHALFRTAVKLEVLGAVS